MEAVQLLLRVDSGFLTSVAANMGIVSTARARVYKDAIGFPVAEGASSEKEWRYTEEAARKAHATCERLGVVPRVPLRPMSRAAYRRKVRGLSPEIPEEQHLWLSLGYHVHNHTQFVQVSEPVALAYLRAKELLHQAKERLAQETVAAIQVDESVAPLEVAVTYMADRIQALASTDAAATIEAGSPPHRALVRLVGGMEDHVEAIEKEREQLVRTKLEFLSQESAEADAHMLDLLKKNPRLAYDRRPLQ